jgi:C4-dicarboxylate transporter/malic acid transport protein
VHILKIKIILYKEMYMPFVNTDQCRGCARCIPVCPVNAISMDSANKAVINQSICTKCGACMNACPFGIILPNSENTELRSNNPFGRNQGNGSGRGAGRGTGRSAGRSAGARCWTRFRPWNRNGAGFWPENLSNMKNTLQNKSKQGFSLESFVPSWPSAVMGTGIIPIALHLGSKRIGFFTKLSAGFSALSMVMLAVISILWVSRFIKHTKKFTEELKHPVSGSFIPTMPISFMIIGINFTVIAPSYIGSQVFFLIGTFGIYLLSWLIMPALFQNNKVQDSHGTFGWYIPPVSHLIVPVLGFELSANLKGMGLSDLYFMISLISFGIGVFLFIFIGANVFYRYLYRSSPSGKMAPTLFIGLAPSSIILIILSKLNSALIMMPELGISVNLNALIIIFGTALWGFSFWWSVLSVIKTTGLLRRGELEFALSWWAFTFPLGAFSVATGALNHYLHKSWLENFQIGITVFLIIVWTYVFIKTITGISDRSIFEE